MIEAGRDKPTEFGLKRKKGRDKPVPYGDLFQ
jgi:hypothetical protein